MADGSGHQADNPLEEPKNHGRSRETERERQLHGLAVLSLFLHSTATIEEMMAIVSAQSAMGE